ncbi:hypothetical protein [Flavobacterium sp.]|uniref:hypothetical protein n=1 Tax=Flavobacterium sp. TaxID=239 RepID=UPI002FDCC0B1
MKTVIRIQKIANLMLVILGILSWFYIILKPMWIGVLIPIYALIAAGLNILLLTFTNKAVYNTHTRIFKDWALFLGMIVSYLFIVLIISIFK